VAEHAPAVRQFPYWNRGSKSVAGGISQSG
jgi:hypothetical protein